MSISTITNKDNLVVIPNNPSDAYQIGYAIGYQDGKRDGASPWHRVEDGLPDKVGSYLVYAPTYRGGSSSEKECKAGVMFARWLKGGHWSIEVGYYKRPGCVTHWMPIEPPKEDA